MQNGKRMVDVRCYPDLEKTPTGRSKIAPFSNSMNAPLLATSLCRRGDLHTRISVLCACGVLERVEEVHRTLVL